MSRANLSSKGLSEWGYVCDAVTWIIAGQVEMKRVGIPAHIPCAVQQWEGLIAGEALVWSACAPCQSRVCPVCPGLVALPAYKTKYQFQLCLQALCWIAAVNYPARAAGITRHMRRAEAKAKCPELQCVHVETIGKLCHVCSFRTCICSV